MRVSFFLIVLFSIVVSLFICSSSSAAAPINNRPVIGILAQPVHESSPTTNSYIAASYVKFIEGAGARVVPIPFDLPKKDLESLALQLNGVLFPGGGVDLNQSPYQRVMEFFLNYSMSSGVYFPVWATCLGFEGVAIAVAGQYSILHSGFNSWNVSMPLEFYPNADTVRRESRLFGKTSMPSEEMFQSFQREALTLNNHHAGVRVSDWLANQNLQKVFRVLSINKDRAGQSFVSTIEAYNYPIYASQWHPEKVSYEWWSEEDINHSYTSLLANQHMANFFVNECRRNNNQFSNNNDLVNRWLIYNYPPTYTFNEEPDFVQMYYFPKN